MEYLDNWHKKGMDEQQMEMINEEGFDPKSYEEYKAKLVEKYYGDQKQWTPKKEEELQDIVYHAEQKLKAIEANKVVESEVKGN